MFLHKEVQISKRMFHFNCYTRKWCNFVCYTKFLNNCYKQKWDNCERITENYKEW